MVRAKYWCTLAEEPIQSINTPCRFTMYGVDIGICSNCKYLEISAEVKTVKPITAAFIDEGEEIPVQDMEFEGVDEDEVDEKEIYEQFIKDHPDFLEID